MNNAKKLSMQDMEKTKGGKFIGYDEWGDCGPIVPNPSTMEPGCSAVCYRSFRVFWIGVIRESELIDFPCP